MTPNIESLFSKEHSVFIFLFAVLFTWQTNDHLKQQDFQKEALMGIAEVKSELKLITYRLNNGNGAETPKKQLATFNLYGCERKPKLQTANPLFACFLSNRERIAKGRHRIY